MLVHKQRRAKGNVMIKCYSPDLDEKRGGWDVETGRGSGGMCEDHKRREASRWSFGEVSGANY